MARPVRGAAVLLLLFLSAAWMDSAQAARRSDREGAISAGRPRKAARGSSVQITSGPNQGRGKAEVFAECLNAMQETMGE